MTDDDFIIEEEGTSSSRRPFLIAVATLTTIFILASVCSLVFLFSNRSATNPEATAIAATNAVILITNEAVTAAIDATNTALANVEAVTATEPASTPTSTSTAIPDTATPTKTVVIKDTPTANVSETSVAEGLTNETDSESNTETGDNDSTPTPIPAATSNASNNTETLPQTGLETWGTLAVGLLLAGVLIAARRLRQN